MKYPVLKGVAIAIACSIPVLGGLVERGLRSSLDEKIAALKERCRAGDAIRNDLKMALSDKIHFQAWALVGNLVMAVAFMVMAAALHPMWLVSGCVIIVCAAASFNQLNHNRLIALELETEKELPWPNFS